ncbi:MAG: hypothetical protein CSA35_03840 [Dethiosulfovibrio peptidovorans]|nr:MAG: hypothetical protein CSA35_03840 [Dethiosulfovibrio peptidovorans]
MTVQRPPGWRCILEVPDDPLVPVDQEWFLDFHDEIRMGGVPYRCPTPVHCTCRFILTGMALRGTFRLRTSVISECSRCLSHLEVAIDEIFEYCYTSQTENDESDDIKDDGSVTVVADVNGSLDVADDLWECLVVSMPLYPVCPEGCDLIGPNTTREEGEAVDPRFQILADEFGTSSRKGGKPHGNP